MIGMVRLGAQGINPKNVFPANRTKKFFLALRTQNLWKEYLKSVEKCLVFSSFGKSSLLLEFHEPKHNCANNMPEK